MIRGKLDSTWKKNENGQLVRGKYATSIDYARRVRGGVAALRYAKNQPWETWNKV